MPLKDYAHWNEKAERIWWEEEGRHETEPPDVDEYDWHPEEDQVRQPSRR